MPIVTIKKSITIHANAPVVFDAITDFDHYAEWNPWFVEAHGQCVEGSVVRARRKILGLFCSGTHTVTEVRSPDKMRWTSNGLHNLLSRADRERQVFPCADGSSLYTVKLIFQGPLAHLAALVARNSVRKCMREETIALKQYCERKVGYQKGLVVPVQKIRSVDMVGDEQPSAELDLL